MTPHEIKSEIEPKLRRGYVTSRVLLGRSRFIDESSPQSSAFNDPSHFPFWYHLGASIKPATVLEIGVGLGLRVAALAQGSPIERFAGLQPLAGGEFYGPRLARSNIRDHADARIEIHTSLPGFASTPAGWDVALLSVEGGDYAAYLDVLWGMLSLGGLLVADYQTRHLPSREAFEGFCRAKNRDPVLIKTRYGVGMAQK